jgi:hypothetical protein
MSEKGKSIMIKNNRFLIEKVKQRLIFYSTAC